mgnify:CR=1 FL=1
MTNESAPTTTLRPDLCVIGASPAGLSAASLAAALGASVVLVGERPWGVERPHPGGLSSTALIAAAGRAEALRRTGAFGIGPGLEPEVDTAKIRAHVQEVVRSAAPMDSPERYRAMGVRVIEAGARFVDRRTVMAGEHAIRARRFVVAVGSRPAIPEIPGLEEVSCLTDESLPDLAARPDHLVILGGSATGIEMAQACRRLGARITVIEAGERILAREDPEMAAVIERALRVEGISIRTAASVLRIERRPQERHAVILKDRDHEEMVEGSHLLPATGRAPDIASLDLDKAGIEAGPAGIKVDRGLRTTNAKVFAVGGCIAGGAEELLQAANHQAGLVVRNVLFRLPVRFGAVPVPRVVRTDPELAAVGLTEEEARARHRGIRILRWSFADNDRARAERETAGHVKAVVAGNGRVLGCAIAGPRAGELIAPWCLAVAKGLKATDLAGLVYPYPTLSEATRSAAVEFLKPSAQNPWIRRLISFVGRLG